MTITEEIKKLSKLIQRDGNCLAINFACRDCFIKSHTQGCYPNHTVKIMAEDRIKELKEQFKKLEFLDKLQ